ncbi:hypothetical protein ABMA27_006280 [Loxostege sticticalis]|uniref:Uncharacterized protein n=1 Tax=Loxostege sticticalis TaxID=481309 RepID=A0ABR3HI83_LOXSC
MDDYLGSVDTVSEAAKLAAEIVFIHSKACLEMRSWVSNRPEALSNLPPDLCAPNAASKSVRVLGVTWDFNADTLSFSRSSMGDLPTKLTKRSTLAYLMKIFDPLGLLTPIIVKGRVIFQKTWKMGVDWDQELPASLILEWKAWFAELSKLKLGSIPRHYLDGRHAESGELHVFGDASEIAYACVAYWRFNCSDGGVTISLIGGKARVAPVKLVSIPRLELQAALMVARFASYIVEAHRHKPSKLFLWSDSLTVLKWIRSDARNFRPFVAHRVGEITEITNVSDWRYVPTALNVADDATRIGKQFETSSRWFSGPSFLYLPEAEWPKEPIKQQPRPPRK